jgi:iron(III) transport system ATP-binding protein
VAQNISFGLPRGERKLTARTEAMLELVGLDRSYASRRPQELSGGEQRRVGLARALAPQPRLVLLDEPFSGLDAHLRSETRAAVMSALAGEGATAVLVTHDQAEALSMGREVAVLRSGRLAQTATPSVLYRTPVNLDVARFVGEAIVVPGAAAGGSVECVLGRLATYAGAAEGPVEVMIRPEQVRLTPGSGVTADVVALTYYGPETGLTLSLRDAAQTPVMARSYDAELPRPGESVEVSVEGPVAVYPTGPGGAPSPAPARGEGVSA